eukprot:1584482-Amphidinium_carterae.2
MVTEVITTLRLLLQMCRGSVTACFESAPKSVVQRISASLSLWMSSATTAVNLQPQVRAWLVVASDSNVLKPACPCCQRCKSVGATTWEFFGTCPHTPPHLRIHAHAASSGRELKYCSKQQKFSPVIVSEGAVFRYVLDVYRRGKKNLTALA